MSTLDISRSVIESTPLIKNPAKLAYRNKPCTPAHNFPAGGAEREPE
jgi:hypothetical protein